MSKITLLHDYHPKRGFTSYLAVITAKQMRCRIGRHAVGELRKRFIELFGYQPKEMRLWTCHLLTAGPIKESKGKHNGKE